MKKFITVVTILCLCIVTLASCTATEADKVNYNMSKQADYFEVERKITVYNARTDKIIFEAEGYMSLDNDSHDELVVTFKTGETTYKKNYVYLTENTLYVVEDINGTHTDPWHYKWVFNSHILPDIEVK